MFKELEDAEALGLAFHQLPFESLGKEPLMRPGRVLTDIERSEHLPLAARLAARSTYELLRAVAEKAPERRAHSSRSTSRASQSARLTHLRCLARQAAPDR
jgi:hypothetical protein